jgi:phage recombination protein Bet
VTSEALALSGDPARLARRGVALDAEALEVLRATIGQSLSHDELGLFVEYVRRTGLDPFTRQIHALKVDGRLAIQVGIDGLRLVAERSGRYAGQLGPMWKAKGESWVDVWERAEPPYAAKLGVLRSDFAAPVWGIAHFASFVQRTREGRPRAMWARMPEHMLAKAAEAQALRRAFPAETSGLYVSLEEGDSSGTRVMVSNPEAKATPAQLGALVQLSRELGWTDEERRHRAEVASFAELTKGRASELIDEWTRILASGDAGPDRGSAGPGPADPGTVAPEACPHGARPPARCRLCGRAAP